MIRKVADQVTGDILVPHTAGDPLLPVHHRDLPVAALVHERDDPPNRIGPGHAHRIRAHQRRDRLPQYLLVAKNREKDIPFGENTRETVIAGDQGIAQAASPHRVKGLAGAGRGIQHQRGLQLERQDLQNPQAAFDFHGSVMASVENVYPQ